MIPRWSFGSDVDRQHAGIVNPKHVDQHFGTTFSGSFVADDTNRMG